MTPAEDSSVVGYTTKELFEEIKRSIEKLHEKIDAKANRAELLELARELDELRTQLTELQRLINELEAGRHVEVRTQAAMQEWKRWSIPVVLTIALLVVAVIQLMKG